MGDGIEKINKGMSIILELQRKSGLDPEPITASHDDELRVVLKTKTIPIFNVVFSWIDNNWIITDVTSCCSQDLILNLFRKF